MSAVFSELVLSEVEIKELTHYSRPKFQLATLKELGIPATLLRDNTVRVLRRDVLFPANVAAASNMPKLKSSTKR